MKLKSDKSFLDFLSSGNSALRIGAALFLGVLLIFIGSFGGLNKADDTAVNAEERTAEMCSLMEGVGECRVMITYADSEQTVVYALLILCDGADSPAVRERIISVCTSLYGIGSNRVEIQKLSK